MIISEREKHIYFLEKKRAQGSGRRLEICGGEGGDRRSL